MTETELKLADRKTLAQISRMQAETQTLIFEAAHTKTQTLKLEAGHDEKKELANRKILSEIDKMRAQTQKLLHETAKVKKESDWYFLVIGSGATLAIAAIVKIFL